MDNLLRVSNLSLSFIKDGKTNKVLNRISFDVPKGSILGIVGESGCGKSVTALSIMKLITPPEAMISGDIIFSTPSGDMNILQSSEEEVAGIRGANISMVFQEPLINLNPNKKCGHQLEEMILLHKEGDKKDTFSIILKLFESVELELPEKIFHSYPHQLSGGQLQRVMIAMALCCNPDLLIADEPTTALDVITQKEILTLIQRLQKERSMTCILISHDLRIISKMADFLMVMKEGEIVEFGPTAQLIAQAQHPYTLKLLSTSLLNKRRTNNPDDVSQISDLPSISFSGINKTFSLRKGLLGKSQYFVKALNEINISIPINSFHGIAGESGSGKSTLARCLVGLEKIDSGNILIDDIPLFNQKSGIYNIDRKSIQMIFQDPYSSLNPRMKVGKAIEEAVMIKQKKIAKGQVRSVTLNLMQKVGLSEDYYDRLPFQLSGGQRQRVCIARALAVEPRILICDEAVSALDSPIQNQILHLLVNIKSQMDLTIIFISHNISLIQRWCDSVSILHLGNVIAHGSTHKIFSNTRDHYIKKLIEASML